MSVIAGLGRAFVLPLLPAFLERYPGLTVDLQLSNRRVDLIADGFDAAVGGGFELAQGMVAKRLAPSHMIAVASPAYMRGRKRPKHPEDLATLDGVVMRSANTGRVVRRVMRDAAGNEAEAVLKQRIVLDDQAAMTEAAELGLGVAVVTAPYVVDGLRRRSLVRLVPEWHADVGNISVYFAARAQLAAKTRVFVDYLTDAARDDRWAERFSGLSSK